MASEDEMTKKIYARDCKDCSSYFDSFWSCGNPRTQIDSYYRSGEFKNCGTLLSDSLKCMRARFYHDEKEKKRLIFSISSNKRGERGEPVWELKEKPSWVESGK
jgi:hypothetical protein